MPKTRYAQDVSHDEPYPERYLWKKNSLFSPQGLVLASGFERGFVFGAAYDGANGILFLDSNNDDLVNVRTNEQMFRFLDFERYSSVRKKPRDTDHNLAHNLELEPEDFRHFLNSAERSAYLYFRRLKPEMNYWLDPAKYHRLQKMAMAGRIVAQPIPFLSPGEPLRELARELEGSSEKIGAILIGADLLTLARHLGSRRAVEDFRSFLQILKPVLAEGAMAYSARPVAKTLEPFYDGTDIQTILNMSDSQIQSHFIDDCELRLVQNL